MIGNYIFSYNRPDYLENLLNSMLYFNFTDSIFLFDDNEGNSPTKNTAKRFKFVQVLESADYNKSSGTPCHKSFLGNLYENMQLAFLHAQMNKFKYMNFLQEDGQFFVNPALSVDMAIQVLSETDECSSAHLVSKFLASKIKYRPIHKYGFKIRPDNPRPAAHYDVSFYDVEKVVHAGCNFSLSNEILLARWWRRRGFYTAAIAYPCLVHAPHHSYLKDRSNKNFMIEPLSLEKEKRYYSAQLFDEPVPSDGWVRISNSNRKNWSPKHHKNIIVRKTNIFVQIFYVLMKSLRRTIF